MRALSGVLSAFILVACAGSGPARPDAAARSAPAAAPATPPAPDGPRVRIAPAEEPGAPLELDVRVLDMDGRPLARAAVVAYHADAKGLYKPPETPGRVPLLRAVGVTDDEGWARFTTIRPGSYPGANPPPAHVHLVVTAPAHHPKDAEVWFEDDPVLTDQHRRAAAAGNAFLVPGGPKAAVTVKLSGN